MSEPVIKTLDDVSEFNELSEFMNDSDLDAVLNDVLKLMVKPDVPFNIVAPMIVRLSAISMKFKIQAKHHMLFNKTDEGSKRKNVYLTASDSIDRLVDSLKYLSRKS